MTEFNPSISSRQSAWAVGDKKNELIGSGTGKNTIAYTPEDFFYKDPEQFGVRPEVLVAIIGISPDKERITLNNDGTISFYAKDNLEQHPTKQYLDEFYLGTGDSYQYFKNKFINAYAKQTNNLRQELTDSSFPYVDVFIKEDNISTRRGMLRRLGALR